MTDGTPVLERQVVRLPDGRRLTYYPFPGRPAPEAPAPPAASPPPPPPPRPQGQER